MRKLGWKGRTAFANNSRGTICKLSRRRKARRKLADDEQSLQEVTAELSAKIASEAAERGRNESRDRFGYGKTDTAAEQRAHAHDYDSFRVRSVFHLPSFSHQPYVRADGAGEFLGAAVVWWL